MGAEVALAATIVSAVASVGGTVMNAMAQSQAAAYQAAIAQRNAQIARNNQVIMENNAKAAEAAGASKADQEALQTRELIGRQKASAAASGLEVNSGSALDITSGTAGLGMWTGFNVRDEASRRAANFRQQGANYGAQAGNYDIQAEAGASASDSALVGGALSAAGGVFKGVSQTQGLLAEFRRTGTPVFGVTLE